MALPVLIGLASSTPGTFYDVNPSTGAATKIVDITGDLRTSFVGSDFPGGARYASDVFANDWWKFGRIDPSTGAFTVINNQDGSVNLHALTANDAAGFLYTVDQDHYSNKNLGTATPTGVISAIGQTGPDVWGLAYDTATGNLYTINTITGVSSMIGNTGLSEDILDLAFAELPGTLYIEHGREKVRREQVVPHRDIRRVGHADVRRRHHDSIRHPRPGRP
jgi:hypothetical protein